MNYLRFFLLILLVPGIVGTPIAFAQGLVVYKHVDTSGKTTYSNQPIKGGAVVELGPLTVLPKTPHAANAPVLPQSTPPIPQTRPADAAPNINSLSEATAPQTPESMTMAVEPPPVVISKQHSTLNPLPRSSLNLGSAGRASASDSRREAIPPSTGSTGLTALQRREEVRRRIIQAEIGAEAQSLVEAKDYLQREQSKSVAMRILRAAIVVDERASAGKRPLNDDIAATKMVVERHFELVRELQDRVLSHEENLAELRLQMRVLPQRAALKTAGAIQSTASVTTAQLGTARSH